MIPTQKKFADPSDPNGRKRSGPGDRKPNFIVIMVIFGIYLVSPYIAKKNE